MYLALGPCSLAHQHFVLAPSIVFTRFSSRRLVHSVLPTRVRKSTHLLPLPKTVVGLVKLLPGGNVVLAVKTREVGHAARRVSWYAPVL